MMHHWMVTSKFPYGDRHSSTAQLNEQWSMIRLRISGLTEPGTLVLNASSATS